MGERVPNDAAPPRPATDDEVSSILADSQKKRDEAHQVVQRADDTAADMSRILRRIAKAMDSNPTSWDTLFRGTKQ